MSTLVKFTDGIYTDKLARLQEKCRRVGADGLEVSITLAFAIRANVHERITAKFEWLK